PSNTTDTTASDKSGRTLTLTAEDIQRKKNDTFGGNEATKKTKKNLLKQQYGNFKAEGSETLEQTFNRLQVIVGQLQFMDVEIEQDDLNQEFVTSLAPEWLMHIIVWRNRSDLDTMSLDDLYNHLKLYESEVQKKPKQNSQNMAFISSAKHSSRNEDGNTASVPTSSTNVPTANKFWKMTGKKLSIQGSDVAGFDKLKVECFNCHKMGHFARECKAPRSQDKVRRDNFRQGFKAEEQAPKALMGIDGVGWDWSYMENNKEDHALVADEVAPTEFALMANTSAESKVFDNSLCLKDCKKKNDSLNKTRDSSARKEGVDGKLAALLTASKNLDNLIESQRLSPTAESILEDDQNRNTSVSETVASPITSEPFIKFVRPKDNQYDNKTDKKETPKKPPVKYAEQYRKPNMKPKARGNQRNWKNLKSQQLGPDFVMKKKTCFNCGNFNHLAIKFVRPKDNQYDNKTDKKETPKKPPVKKRVKQNFTPTGSRNFSTANRKFPTASRKFPTGSTKSITADMGLKGKAGSSQNKIDDKGYWDSGCSRHMTDNISYLFYFEPYDGGYVSFGQGGCKITEKGRNWKRFKRIFRYLKGHPKLGLWYPKESPFNLVSFSDNNYGGATQDRKYTTGGCQFLGRRLISWQCKKQTIVATSTTKAEYVAAASCCGQVLWIQNQLLDYGDVNQGEACPTDSDFIADQDRATIDKSSTLPHDSAPRVTSPAVVEGSMQQTILELTALCIPTEPHPTPSPEAQTPSHTTHPSSLIPPINTTSIPTGSMQQTILELTALCTSMQRQLSELTDKLQAQEVEINRLKERVKQLEEREGVAATNSGDDAPIKKRSMDGGEAATERSDCKTILAKLITTFENAFNLEFKERMQKYTRFDAQSFKDAMVCNMDSIGKYMLQIILHQQRTPHLLKQKKLMRTQEDHSNPIQALNIDSLKVDLVVIQSTCSEVEDTNSETASSKSVKESSLDSATKDVIKVKHFRDTLLQHMGNVKKSVVERTRHQRQYDRRVNKRQTQTQDNKIDTGKAVDDDLVVTESSGTESKVQDDNSRSGNDTYADDADIIPIYDEEPLAEI
nr:putative reverse transcriptase, RNA-dependent DNA polymerase [Tanacetum cinerariifolium]